MGDIVQLRQKEQVKEDEAIPNGETCFPACAYCGETYVPLVMMGDAPFVAALVCAECDTEVPLINGYLQE